MWGARNERCLVHERFSWVLVFFALAFTPHVLTHILHLVKNTALIQNTVSRHESDCFSSTPAPLTYHHLQSLLSGHFTHPQTLQEEFPLRLIFAAGDLPIEDLSSPVWPQAECHQDHDFFSAALMALPLLSVRLNGFILVLNGHPHAIPLNHCRRFWDMLIVHVMHERLHLMNALMNGTESNRTSELTAPSLFDGSQTLPWATAQEGILLEISPTPLILLQESTRT